MIDNREWALLIWSGAILTLSLRMPAVRSSMVQLVKILLQPVLVIPVLLMVVWVESVVYGAARVGLWETSLASETVAWFLGTAIVLMFNMPQSRGGELSFQRVMLGAIGAGVFVEVFVNDLFVFSLIAELTLLPILTFLFLPSVVSRTKDNFKVFRKVADWILALTGIALFTYVLFRVLNSGQDLDWMGVFRLFALPVWLVIGVAPFMFLLRLLLAYDQAFRLINHATEESYRRWRGRFALILKLRTHAQNVASFTTYWSNQLAATSSFYDARCVIDKFKASRLGAQRAIAEADERLQRYVDVDGTDEFGAQLDQREFRQTKDALRILSTAQMGWHRNRGGRYRSDLVEILQSRFESRGLPEDHGISLWVAHDGQSWWAWRRTITGWCFAIGAEGSPSDEWLYDGLNPPTGPPGTDPSWGERWGIDAKNW